MHTKLRNSWKLGGVGCGLLILEMFAHPGQGALVLREDWNSGRVDSNRWEVVGWPINSMLVDLGHGDWAMRLQDISRGNAYSICYAWEAIVRCADGEARVQLLLNRASPWLDIDSYLPYEGKVVIRNKAARRLSVRIPRWANKGAVQVRLGTERVIPSWLGNYVILDTIRPGDRVTITFPMVTTTEGYTLKWKLSEMWQESTDPGREWINANPTTYTMTFKGNTLVDVTPRDSGKGLPLYEREPMLEATAAPMKTVTRFVADTTP